MNYKIFLSIMLFFALINVSAQNPMANSDAMVVSGNARFTILTPQMVRMEWCDSAKFEDHATLGVINRQSQTPRFTVKRTKSQLTITTNALKIIYATGREFGANNPRVEFMLNDKKIVWNPQSKDTCNLKGTARTLDGYDGYFRHNSKKKLQLENGVISRSGWALIDESERHVLVADDSRWKEWVAARSDGKHIDWYLMAYGHDYKQAIADFTLISGKVPLPPKYAFGYWWSHYWQYSDNEFCDLADMMKSMSVPLDIMVVDMDWHETWGMGRGNRPKDEFGQRAGWTGYTWQKELFPAPDKFLQSMKQRGLRVTLNLHPASGIRTVESVYDAFVKEYEWDSVGKSVPFHIDQVKWADAYFKSVLHPMQKMGVDFWWLDWQQWLESKYTKKLSNTFWLNHTFFHDNDMSSHERPMIYHRWGGLGSHRYQVAFSGDTRATWNTLGFLPYFTATASNVCYGYWGHDIGGHAQSEAATNPELYTRWLQYGVFTPIFKTHATKSPNIERRIWRFPDYFEPMRAAIRLRYSLSPYIYSAARACYDTGISLCRPLYYTYPEQDEAYNNDQQFMFGDDILATCIAEPIGANGTSNRHIWFPQGRWFDMASGTMYDGNSKHDLHYTIDENPYYVKAGAVLTMAPDTINTLQHQSNVLVLTVIPGDNGTTSLYEDEGANKNYAKEFATTTIRHNVAGNTTTLCIEPRVGTYNNMPSERRYVAKFISVFPPKSVKINGVEVPYDRFAQNMQWSYDGYNLATEVYTEAMDCGKQTLIELVFDDYATANASKVYGKSGLFRRCLTLTKEFKFAFGKIFQLSMLPQIYLKVSQTPNFITEDPANIAMYLTDLEQNLKLLPAHIDSIEGLDSGFKQKLRGWMYQ